MRLERNLSKINLFQNFEIPFMELPGENQLTKTNNL